MKNIKYILIFSLVTAVVFSSCKKEFMDRQPQDQEVTSNY